MNALRLAVVCSFVFFATSGYAGDLTTIDRSIAKTPDYQSTSPKYCLLVFGPEASTRVWIVRDGDVLFVDRNCNGDLTEPDEKVVGKREEHSTRFDVGEIRDGTLRHQDLEVVNYDAKATLFGKEKYRINVNVECPDRAHIVSGTHIRQRARGADSRGLLQLALRPEEAPVIHFGGPWSIEARTSSLTIGATSEFSLRFGTPGLGSGSFASVLYEGVVPEDVFPELDFTFPGKDPGAKPMTRRHALKFRC